MHWAALCRIGPPAHTQWLRSRVRHCHPHILGIRTGPQLTLNATATLSSRVKNFVDAWQDGAMMSQSELDTGQQDRNAMVLLPPPSKKMDTDPSMMAQAPPAQVVATGLGVPLAAVPPAPNSVPAPPPAVSAVQK